MGYHDYLDLTEEFKCEDFPVAGLNDSGERVVIDRYDGDEQLDIILEDLDYNDAEDIMFKLDLNLKDPLWRPFQLAFM